MADTTPTTGNTSSSTTTSGTTATKGATGQVSTSAANASTAANTATEAQDAKVPEFGELVLEDPTTTAPTETSDAIDAAKKAADEENAARAENPDKVVYRKTDDASFFEVGQVNANG